MHVDDSIRKAIQLVLLTNCALHILEKSVGYIRFNATAVKNVDQLWTLPIIATVKS